jgi:hypothetical protein
VRLERRFVGVTEMCWRMAEMRLGGSALLLQGGSLENYITEDVRHRCLLVIWKRPAARAAISVLAVLGLTRLHVVDVGPPSFSTMFS